MYSPYATPRAGRRTAGGTPARLAPTDRERERTHTLGRSPSATPSAYSRSMGTGSPMRARYTASEAPSTGTAVSASVYTQDGEATGANPRRNPVFLSDVNSRLMRFGEVPAEVQEDLRSADHMYVSPVRAEIDAVSGYASITTAHATYVWNYRKTSYGRPSAYTFPYPAFRTPSSPDAADSVPFARLVPHGASATEPGLLLAFPDGQLWYWDAVSVALTFRLGGAGGGARGGSVKSAGPSVAGGLRLVERSVELGSEDGMRDAISGVYGVGSGQFILTTAHASAHLLILSYAQGGTALDLAPLRIGSFMRSRTRLFAGSVRAQGEDQGWRVRAVCATGGPGGGGAGGEVWIANARRVQRWSVARGAPKLLAEHVVGEILERAEEPTHDVRDGQVMALATTSSGTLVALLSFSTAPHGDSAEPETLSYALAVLDPSTNDDEGTGHSLELVRLLRLGYRAHLDHRLLPPPSVVLPSSAPIAFVQFAGALVAVSLDLTLPYENVVTLKDSSNVFIGTLHHTGRSERKSNGTLGRLLAVSTASGVLSWEVNLAPDTQGVPDEIDDDALLLRKLEQAVFFGSDAGNPLSFELQPGFKGSFANAAFTLSERLVANRGTFCPRDVDIAKDLDWRASRLRALIHFIRENGVLQDRACLRQLSAHAEMVEVAKALWRHLNEDGRMAGVGQMKAGSLLADVIAAFMAGVETTPSQDPIRDFFHDHLFDLEEMLAHVHRKLAAQTSRLQNDIQAVSEWQAEANAVYELVYQHGLQHAHEENVSIYGITREYSLPTETWLTSEQCLSQLVDIYHRTVSVMAARVNNYGSSVNNPADDGSSPQQRLQQRLKQQLVKLAGPLCFALEEQIRYLAFRSEVEGPAGDAEKMLKTDQYREAIGNAIRALAAVDLKRAFITADHHNHYGVLVELSSSDQYGSTDSIHKFVASKGEPFTDALFSHYVEHGKYATLLDQPEDFESYLSVYFEKHSLPWLSWLQNLRVSRYNDATADLVAYSQQVSVLEGQQLSLSLGKLSCLVAAAEEADAAGVAEVAGDKQATLDLFDVHLHLTQVCADVRHHIRRAARIGAKDTNDAQATKLEQFTQLKCNKATSRKCPLMLGAYRHAAATLVDGGVIDAEDVIDVVTLMDNEDEDGLTRIFRCFEIFVRDDRIPTLRKQMLLISMWRRVYLRDDWVLLSDTGSVSDAEVKARVEQTAAARLIQVLRTGQLNGYMVPPQYVLSPEQTLAVLDPAQLQQRYPALLQGDAEQLHLEYVKEVDELRSLLDTTRLAAYVDHLLHG